MVRNSSTPLMKLGQYSFMERQELFCQIKRMPHYSCFRKRLLSLLLLKLTSVFYLGWESLRGERQFLKVVHRSAKKKSQNAQQSGCVCVCVFLSWRCQSELKINATPKSGHPYYFKVDIFPVLLCVDFNGAQNLANTWEDQIIWCFSCIRLLVLQYYLASFFLSSPSAFVFNYTRRTPVLSWKTRSPSCKNSQQTTLSLNCYCFYFRSTLSD